MYLYCARFKVAGDRQEEPYRRQLLRLRRRARDQVENNTHAKLLLQLIKLQGVHQILCFFEIFKNIPDSCLSQFSLGVSVCTPTRELEHQRCSRTGRVKKESQSFKEKTQYLMNTL